MIKTLKKLSQYLFDSNYRVLVNSRRGIYRILSDEHYVRLKYKAVFGKEINLNSPKSFNEKLQWLKLYDRKPEYTIMVDKYLVREYVKKTIGEEYLIPLIGVWEKPEDIDFDEMPSQFVLKCNHNSGLGMCICKDKSKINFENVRRELRRGLAQNYYITEREWPYRDVQKKIVAEQYLLDESLQELRDYKFFCFNGHVEFFKVDFDRFIEHRANYYSREGKLLLFGETICPPNYEKIIDLPKQLPEMIRLAELLSKDKPFVRIDLYNTNNRIYFGEITFFPASGFGTFVPEGADEEIGELLQLPL